MSEVLKGVPCDDCFGTYDSHESGCRTLELEKLREENARMRAVVDAARNLSEFKARFGRTEFIDPLCKLFEAVSALDDGGAG